MVTMAIVCSRATIGERALQYIAHDEILSEASHVLVWSDMVALRDNDDTYLPMATRAR